MDGEINGVKTAEEVPPSTEAVEASTSKSKGRDITALQKLVDAKHKLQKELRKLEEREVEDDDDEDEKQEEIADTYRKQILKLEKELVKEGVYDDNELENSKPAKKAIVMDTGSELLDENLIKAIESAYKEHSCSLSIDEIATVIRETRAKLCKDGLKYECIPAPDAAEFEIFVSNTCAIVTEAARKRRLDEWNHHVDDYAIFDEKGEALQPPELDESLKAKLSNLSGQMVSYGRAVEQLKQAGLQDSSTVDNNDDGDIEITDELGPKRGAVQDGDEHEELSEPLADDDELCSTPPLDDDDRDVEDVRDESDGVDHDACDSDGADIAPADVLVPVDACSNTDSNSDVAVLEADTDDAAAVADVPSPEKNSRKRALSNVEAAAAEEEDDDDIVCIEEIPAKRFAPNGAGGGNNGEAAESSGAGEVTVSPSDILPGVDRAASTTAEICEKFRQMHESSPELKQEEVVAVNVVLEDGDIIIDGEKKGEGDRDQYFGAINTEKDEFVKKWLEQTDDKPADLEDDVIASNAENLENGIAQMDEVICID